jgi:hypothetical protein
MAALALAVGSCVPAFGQSLVTENFNLNTDNTWEHLNNNTGGETYKWNDTDITGNTVNPPGGTATENGEMGGNFARSGSLPNYYGFNIGSFDPTSEAFQAAGVLRVTAAAGGTGFNLGFFSGATSFGSGGDAANFIGLGFNDMTGAQAYIYNNVSGRDRSGVETQIPVGTTVPFSLDWQPAPAGEIGKGLLTATINGVQQQFSSSADLDTLDPITHFGVFGISADGNTGTVFFDDFTFTSKNPLGGVPGWGVDRTGDWTVASNWVGPVPNGAGATATFGQNITADTLVYANTDVTAGTINFDNAHRYLLAGLGTLNIEDTDGTANVNVLQGSHKINLPVIVKTNTIADVAAGASLLVSDPITINSGVSLSQTGAGTVTFESTVNVLTGGSIAFGSSSHVASLSLASAAKASIAQGGGKVLSVDSLSSAGTTDAWTSQIDVKDNDMIVHSSSSARVAKAAEITNQLKQGANFANAGQFWTGNGIVTSLGGNGSTSYTAVGVAINDFATLGGAQTGAIYSTFDGQAVGVNDVLVKYTYFGDADLDGAVTTNDYFQIDNGFLGSKTGWINGDFDYDGAVTTNDYFLIDNAFLGQGSALVPAAVGSASALSGVTAVPEPASLGVFAIAAAGLLRRRRR